MTEPFHASAEQIALINECTAFNARFIDQPELHGSASAIAAARALIQRASASGVPRGAYSGLQIAVSMAETDAELPEQYRQYKPLP